MSVSLWWGVPLLFILTYLIIDTRRRLTATRRSQFIRHITFVVRRNLPLINALCAGSRSEPRKIGLPLRRLGQVLETGIPLSDAIRTVWPSCPSADYSILQSAEQAGTLPDALTSIEKRYRRDLTARYIDDNRIYILPFVTLMTFVAVYWLTVIFTIPKFRVILEDFDVKGPQFSTEILLAEFGSHYPPTTWYGVAFHLLVLIVVLGVPAWIVGSWIIRAMRKFDFVRWITDGILWFIPISKRVEIAEGCVMSLPTARLALAAGWPLEKAVQMAASVSVNSFWQSRLEDWHNELVSGQDAITAARRARMPETLLRYLAVGASDGDFNAPLFAAEEYYAVLLDRRRHAIRTTMWFLSTMVAGLIVGCMCVAFMMMLRDVIDRTAMTWYLA